MKMQETSLVQELCDEKFGIQELSVDAHNLPQPRPVY